MAAPQETSPPIATTEPSPAPAASKKSPIDQQDLHAWTSRFSDVLARPKEVIQSKSAEGSQPWYAGLFGCFSPIDTCLITFCVPCVTFGKTHHRVEKDGSLAGYEPINTSCLLFCAAGCVGLPCIPVAMQRMNIRQKYHLQGSCLQDLVLSCCCNCCVMIQSDKEAEHREGLLSGSGVQEEYQGNKEGMEYPPGVVEEKA
ncbi:hypothetical protein E4U55_002566 [Claviceps digitariae]|nr:hypothetical protein E4U55_002566 [Claviceps digitariae]